MSLKDFNLKERDLKILLAVLIFGIILNAYYISFNLNLGIYCSDVYVYLLNALYFTGTNINSTQTIYLSPIICFLTSLLFDIGLEGNAAILIVTAAFAAAGNVGLYILFRTRFDELLSLCGVIVYSTFALNLTWLSNGSIDIPAAGITIWIVLLTVVAVRNNPKYYQILPTAFIIGFFTRYTVVLIFPVLVLYYLYHNGFEIEKNNIKYISKGLLFAALASAIILIPVLSMGNGNFAVGGQISGGITGGKGSADDLAYNTDISYYLANFVNFISATKITFANRTPVLESPSILSYITLAILAIGALLFGLENSPELNRKNLAALALLLIGLATFNRISSFATILMVFFALLLIGKDGENRTGLAMLGWILVYLIFFSYYSIKVNRYIIPAIAPLIYLLLAAVELIRERIPLNINIIPIVLIALFLIQGFAFTSAFEQTDQFVAPQEMSDYITEEIPDYENLTVGVYNMRFYNWYLGGKIIGIESGDTAKIENADIDYYISDIAEDDLDGFREIKSIDNLYLYQKTK